MNPLAEQRSSVADKYRICTVTASEKHFPLSHVCESKLHEVSPGLL